MPPLILHNVPDEELYVGDDGIQRPYAMYFPGADGTASTRVRRHIPETGSFGKSTRRSRSRTGTPAAKREDPTLAASDRIFAEFLSKQPVTSTSESQRKVSGLSASISQSNLSTVTSLGASDGNAGPAQRYVHKEPTEVILRGFKSSLEWAAIRQYEQIAGHICEDYPRDPEPSQTKYTNSLGHDPASSRRRALTAEEKAKALKFAGGDHWIKITFESAEAAETAVDNSPQIIYGYSVSAELYRGVPPTDLKAVPAVGRIEGPKTPKRKQSNKFNTMPAMSQIGRGLHSFSPESASSSQTLDTGTLSTSTITSLPVQGLSHSTSTVLPSMETDTVYCRKIPTAKRIQLLPAERALLPQKSYSQRIMSKIPLLSWFSSDIIGSQIPTKDDGQFDWANASFYWRIVYWVDGWTGWFDVRPDKES